MLENLKKSHETLWSRFYCEQTNLLYDYELAYYGLLPSRKEVAASIPNCSGWGTGMEDCALTAGFVIAAMLKAHQITGESVWKDKSRRLFRGLAALGRASGEGGYIARGFAPGRDDVYPNSSADQYTSFVFGMWSYARSPVADAAERETAAELLESIAKRVEAFNDDIPRLDGKPSIFGDTSAMTPDRACRIIQFYRAAYDLTGDERWNRRYRERLEENDYARAGCHFGPEAIPEKSNTHAVAQSQIAFRLLYDSESDPSLREMCAKALNTEAEAVLHFLADWRKWGEKPVERYYPPRWRRFWPSFIAENPDYDPSQLEQVQRWFRYCRDNADRFPPTPEEEAAALPALPWMRRQTESLAVVMLCADDGLKQQAAEFALPMLEEIDWSLIRDARVWESVDLGYWLGVESGLFPK